MWALLASIPIVISFLGPTAVVQDAVSSRGMVSLKNKQWGVAFVLPGFSIDVNETKSDGRRYLMATNKETGVNVSLFLEEVMPGTRTKSCRQTLEMRKQDSFPKKDARITETGIWTRLEYLIPEIEGMKLKQKNLFACNFRDDVFIDFHFSKVSYQPSDDKLFQDIMDTVAIQEGILRTSKDYWEVGSIQYRSKNYKMAIPSYALALELEKKNPQLEKMLWYVLIDNLGMAYGITGDLPRAKETFEYGLSKDPAYPLFYYNLACTFAEMNDSQNAAAFLKKAFEFQKNVLSGEKMPDPRKDDSFKRLLKDKDFKALVESLAKKVN